MIAERRALHRPSVVSAVDLMAEPLPEVRFVIEPVLAEGLTILAGKPKLGKSWLVLGWALAVACGGRALGKLGVLSGDVLYLGLEDTRRRLQSRLVTMLDDGDGPPPRLHLATEWPRLDAGGLDELDRWLDEHAEARLVVIDTLAKARGRAKRRDGRGYDEDYDDLAELRKRADRSGLSIIVVHHKRKMAAEDPLDTVSGTLGLAAAADAVLVLDRSRGAGDATLHVSGRDLEEAKYALTWAPSIGAWSLDDDIPLGDVSEARAEIIRYLTSVSKPMTPSHVAVALNRPLGSIKRLMWKMGNGGQLAGGGREGYRVPTVTSEPSEPSEPDESPAVPSVRAVRPVRTIHEEPPEVRDWFWQ